MNNHRISKEETLEVLNLTEKDITRQLLIDWLANTAKGRKFDPEDIVTLPKGTMGLKEDTDTTVGRVIFNRFIIEPFLLPFTGYINEPITSKKLSDIEAIASDKLVEKEITPEQFIDYINRVSWLGYTPNDFLTPSVCFKSIKPLDSVVKRKEELIKAHKEDLEQGNEIVGAAIEKELIDLAKKEIGDNPSMDLFNSGAKGSFNNNYKNTSIMRGPIKNSSTNKWMIATSDYINGIKKEEYSAFGDLIVSSVYPGAVGTQKSGLTVSGSL